MGTVSEERMKEMEETKAAVKKMNVEAVAKMLTDMQTNNHKVKSEQLDLKRMVTNVTQDLAVFRAEINALKAMGSRGVLGGTGSTVHKKGE